MTRMNNEQEWTVTLHPEGDAKKRVKNDQVAIKRSLVLDRKVGMPFAVWFGQACQTLPEENVQKLYRQLCGLTDRAAAMAANMSPCKRGCAHCCHIPIMVTEWEAKQIGRAIGQEPQAIAKSEPRMGSNLLESVKVIASGYQNPCPFLKNSACSIYRHRPLACRSLVSLDETNLNCRHDKGIQGVNYLNLGASDMTLAKAVMSLTPSILVADLREWFAERQPEA